MIYPAALNLQLHKQHLSDCEAYNHEGRPLTPALDRLLA